MDPDQADEGSAVAFESLAQRERDSLTPGGRRAVEGIIIGEGNEGLTSVKSVGFYDVRFPRYCLRRRNQFLASIGVAWSV